MLKALDKLEYAGWGFLGISFVIFAGPGVWVVWRYTHEGTEVMTRVGSGLFLASVMAAFFTFVVNDLLHRRNLRRHQSEPSDAANKTSRKHKQ